MSDKTGIAWTDATWNPLRGCSKVSAGCANCYAEGVASRFSGEAMPYHGLARGGRWTGRVRLVPEKLDQPLRWKKPRRIFVNSMSDLFHERVADLTIAAIFAVMAASPQHTFQVLTKRPDRMRAWFRWADRYFDGMNTIGGLLDESMRCALERRWIDLRLSSFEAWPFRNVHLGVSVEDQATADARIPVLLDTPAAVRFVSYEPALGPVDFTAKCPPSYAAHLRDDRIGWVIVGGESGPRARPCDVAWIRSTVAQCRAAGVPCFVKQLGSLPMGAMSPMSEASWGGTVLNGDWKPRIRHRAGADPAEWPEDLRVQEFPT